MELNGKRVLITGAASGIGKAIALEFARAGAIVIVSDIDGHLIDHTVNEIKTLGHEALGLIMDVTQEDAVVSGIEALGPIDVLVSNAGVQHIESVDTLSYEHWKKVLAIHLDGAFLTTKACLKSMYERQQGNIIYIGSVHSKEASVLKAPYVTAKHGLLGLCRVVAKEGAAFNVRANVVCPGFVKTPLVEAQIPLQAKALGISEDEVIKKVMLGKTVDGEFTDLKDIANACLFFASSKSNALTGQSLIVSHGWYME